VRAYIQDTTQRFQLNQQTLTAMSNPDAQLRSYTEMYLSEVLQRLTDLDNAINKAENGSRPSDQKETEPDIPKDDKPGDGGGSAPKDQNDGCFIS